jgi:glycine/D-amino acid oxidase-like deaminating enzyme
MPWIAGRRKDRRNSRMNISFENKWGKSPWRIAFRPKATHVPRSADVVIVGGGFSGLSAAASLAHMAPHRKIVLLEAAEIGAGASGRTGGMTLAETAGGDLPGLGNVLQGFAEILRELKIDCDFLESGAWEVGRSGGKRKSEISWQDAGRLRVIREIPGGTVDAGKLLGGLTRAATDAGAYLVERCAVSALHHGKQIRVVTSGGTISAGRVLVATNAQSLDLAGLQDQAVPKLTVGVATEPLSAQTIRKIGMASRRPFYTVDLPYLWGRLTSDNRAMFGCGLVTVSDWKELHTLDVRTGHSRDLLETLKRRVRGLDPALRNVKFRQAWGGPILLTDRARPIFKYGRRKNVMHLCGYNGHGVALSVYLGRWAAEAMLGARKLPHWNRSDR